MTDVEEDRKELEHGEKDLEVSDDEIAEASKSALSAAVGDPDPDAKPVRADAVVEVRVVVEKKGGGDE